MVPVCCSRGLLSCSLFIVGRVFIVVVGGAIRETEPLPDHSPCFEVVGSQTVSLSLVDSRRHQSVRSLSKPCATHRNIDGRLHRSDSSGSTDATLSKRLTSGPGRRLPDPNCRHLDAMVSELQVQDKAPIDGRPFTEVERSCVVRALGTEHH